MPEPQIQPNPHSSACIWCDKKLHHKLPCATPSVWGNPTEICVSSNAGV